MLMEFTIILFLQYALRKERELHERSSNKQTQRETHDTINVGLHQTVTSMEFFPQCLDFLFLVFNRGDVGDNEVFDYFLKE